MLMAYRMKLKPTKEQIKISYNVLNISKDLYNHLLDLRKRHYNNYKKSISKSELDNYCTFLKSTDEWKSLNDIHSHLVQDVTARLESAYTNFFEKRAGFPKFKSRDHYKSFTFKQPSKMNLFSNEGFIKLPKIGNVKLINHRNIDLKSINKTDKIKTLNIKNENNSWYATITIEVEIAEPKIKSTEIKAVGLDLGISHYIALSNGLFVENPKFLRLSEAKLKQLQRKFSRSKQGSKNQGKLKRKINKLHLKIKNQRRDFLHKISLQLVKDYDLIVYEDLNVKNMIKNHKLAKSISDASWSTFINYLNYKAKMHNKLTEAVDPKGTSQTCLCGNPVPKTLKNRVHSCPTCGIVEDRDTHSAKVILSRSKYTKTT
jgi:putative transposase